MCLSDCFYCGGKPTKRVFDKNRYLIANGVDRLDSSIGYTVSNTVPCCSICNPMKSSKSVDDFISHVNKIVKHMQTKDR